MVYTEKRTINGREYYYRVLSVRNGKKISKKRVYLGVNLGKKKLKEKEEIADKKLLFKRKEAVNKEINNIKSKIVGILKKHKVTRAGIVGSYARGEQKKNSDLDIVVNIEDKNMSLLGFIALNRLLEESLRKKVDLVEYQAIRSRIKENLLKDEVRII